MIKLRTVFWLSLIALVVIIIVAIALMAHAEPLPRLMPPAAPKMMC